MARDRQSSGLAIIRIFLGVFFLFEAFSKRAWFLDGGILGKQLSGWHEEAVPWARWYLDTVALPYAPWFARLVPLGELATGLAFVFGVWTRLAALLAFLMVLNIHVASSRIFQFGFLTNGYGLPVLGPLLGLAIGGTNLPLSLKRGKAKGVKTAKPPAPPKR